MEKMGREAKLRTTWTSPDAAYEEAIALFGSAGLSPPTGAAFLGDFVRSCRPLWLAGAINCLSQLALKLFAPGVPDIYQGCELWDFSLVDPDNRRPVDFARRESLLSEPAPTDPLALVDNWLSGAPKMALTIAGLHARRQHPALFAAGSYTALAVTGRSPRDRKSTRLHSSHYCADRMPSS